MPGASSFLPVLKMRPARETSTQGDEAVARSTRGTHTVMRLIDIVSDDEGWWSLRRLEAFLATFSSCQARRVEEYRTQKTESYFGAFRRTRNGRAVREVRADEIAGALRTTRGGSARQALLRAGHGELAARWMNVTEYARPQGAGEMRFESVSAQQAMFAPGDAVCVPVIEWVARRCLLPLITA